MNPLLISLSTLALFSISIAQQSDDALRCKDHPAYSPSLNPVLISSWDYDLSSPEAEQLVYLPRYTGHAYAPIDDPSSTKFIGLDFFHTADFRRAPSFRMTFQRDAMVCIFVNVETANFDPDATVTLRGGWKSEGWVERVAGDATITYGVQETITRTMTRYAYVFSKNTNGQDYVDLPQTRFVKGRIVGITVPGSFNVWVAEADGSPSPPVGNFQGTTIKANTQCPQALHDVWVTPDDNPNDPDTNGVMFTTWHPQWDPCFWCAYDHEHGSSPKFLMNYTPKFTYTAWKNDRQDESDRGFKGFVLRTSAHLIYYSLHAVQSNLRRVSVRFHTINLAIVDRRTKELLMDVQQKGDFGWAGVRLLGGKTFRAINPAEEAVMAAQGSGPNNFRSINILDVNNPNPEFEIRNPVLIGQYEVWQTLPMCSKPNSRNALLNVQLKLPNTGFKALDQPEVVVDLGRKFKGKFYKSVGLNRSIKASKLEFAAEHCPGNGTSGVFYTDPKGLEIRPGPGPTSVRQFVKPGFKGVMTGRYETTDSWTGLHFKGARGFFADHGYGIDADNN